MSDNSGVVAMTAPWRTPRISDPWQNIPSGRLLETQLSHIQDRVVARDSGEVVVEKASIVLHVGEVVWRTFGRDAQRELLGIADEIEIEPGEVVHIVSDERLTLPDFVFGKALPKGRMPSIGLLCTSTTIDPGFDNYLLWAVINVGEARVRLPRGFAFAKVELVRLPSSVEHQLVSRENVKTNLPRDDYLIAETPLVQESFRLEAVLEAQRSCEDRFSRIEADIAKSSIRHRRLFAIRRDKEPAMHGGIVSGKDLAEAIDKGIVLPKPDLAQDERREDWVISLHLSKQFLEYHPISKRPVSMPSTLPTRPIPLNADNAVILTPGASLLACTEEEVDIPHDLIGWVFTKGNVARGFLSAHVCDGQIDPGYAGKITLELLNHGPLTVALRPGMAIANLYLMKLTSATSGYEGRFWGSTGPTPLLGQAVRPVPYPSPSKTVRWLAMKERAWWRRGRGRRVNW
jgi:dCTP deaminase